MKGPVNGAAIRLRFRPHVDLVASARQFVSDFYDHVLGDPDVVSRVAVATHELLENVIKYASDGRTDLEIDLDETATGDIVRIRASNRTTPERASVVRALVAELEATDDPRALYVRMMRRSAMHDDGSGLGLIRIRAESNMNVHCQVRGDVVTIIVEGSVVPPNPKKVTVSP